MGENRWRDEAALAARAGPGEGPLYLTSNGHANTPAGDGRLVGSPSRKTAGTDQYVYDPSDPVPHAAWDPLCSRTPPTNGRWPTGRTFSFTRANLSRSGWR